MTDDYQPRHIAEDAEGNPLVPVENQSPVSGMLSNRTYDRFKPVATTILPALITFWLAIGAIWGLPRTEEVALTLGAANVLLGALLNVSTRSYNRSDAKYDGVIHVEQNEDGKPVASMVLKNYEDPAAVVQQKEVTFKVTGQQ